MMLDHLPPTTLYQTLPTSIVDRQSAVGMMKNNWYVLFVVILCYGGFMKVTSFPSLNPPDFTESCSTDDGYVCNCACIILLFHVFVPGVFSSSFGYDVLTTLLRLM
jgi:hypothetical protein